MTTEKKKAAVRRVFDEVWSRGELDVADDLLSYEFVGHPEGLGGPLEGPSAAKEFIGRLREGFPDMTFTTQEIVAEGDVVATRWIARGTHEAEYMGYEPTDRNASISGMTFFRFDGDRIAEGWTQVDTLGLMTAIGAVRELARA